MYPQKLRKGYLIKELCHPWREKLDISYMEVIIKFGAKIILLFYLCLLLNQQ
ncbi:hypothetical protein M2459_002035 [Parabacteroides sp. PF5-5]|nr:hypothetical protein [Parabacteroides sp. PH5-39]MDH6316394.1 hypothetical protein [Parabacteroides sp. PF5-13]MDH6319879.1 hypothetical protein [Parabacteroides sp. PH5-13]MDH6323530.1 hypothetical protein [Parabacteroides sp. PH5-8]MDH6327581.1 hypothetical protein [Parabacteroides sp. PH5-41]MDH6335279.1 hypothetical protein [Parabacteroides sp. PF5-5]MDH6346342.1 hypothetical protein [Parabacteroides sp. PH5-46]MDH6361407.1 hypothetical protein [Parabacteroides sp. PH5-16]MDH6377074.